MNNGTRQDLPGSYDRWEDAVAAAQAYANEKGKCICLVTQTSRNVCDAKGKSKAFVVIATDGSDQHMDIMIASDGNK